MRGKSTWHYRPYTRLTQTDKRCLPYICRLAPYENTCQLEWMDNGFDGKHIILLSDKATGELRRFAADAYCVTLTGLKAACEYTVRVCREGTQGCSDTRLIRTGAIPGTVINYLHPDDDFYAFSGRCLCSPSIVRLPSGKLVVSMDVYAMHYPQNLTLLFSSEDNGKTWHYLTDLFPCFWGKLFTHRGALYMISTSSEYGFLLIGRSDDEGLTWTAPTPLFPGSGMRCEEGMHQAPNPVICHHGRIYTAVDYGTWDKNGHCSALVSAPEDSDLLCAQNWRMTELVPFSHQWEGAVPESRWGCLEGNAVVTPDGGICDVLRYQISYVFKDNAKRGSITHGKALILYGDLEDNERALRFGKFISFNGGMSKFSIRRDEKTGAYISLVNRVTDADTPAQRNVVSLAVSMDMENWQIKKDLLDFSDMDPQKVGFQYVDFIFDGEDILYVSRTAWNGAVNFHDSNYITFHTLKDFRGFL